MFWELNISENSICDISKVVGRLSFSGSNEDYLSISRSGKIIELHMWSSYNWDPEYNFWSWSYYELNSLIRNGRNCN